MRNLGLSFFAIQAGLPVPLGVAHPAVAKIVAYRLSPAFVAPVHFTVERAGGGASFLFCVVGIIKTGIGVCAVAIGTRTLPVVPVRVCFPICTPANPAHGGRCAIRIPKVGTVFRIGVAGVARADAGVGLISVGRPSAPVMLRRVNPAAHGAGGRRGAGRCAEGTILRFGSVAECAIARAGAGMGAVAVGFPKSPIVVAPSKIFRAAAAFLSDDAACRIGVANKVILQDLFLAVIAPQQMLIFVLF